MQIAKLDHSSKIIYHRFCKPSFWLNNYSPIYAGYEFDIQLTSDEPKKIIVLHDRYLADGKVAANLSFNELKSYHDDLANLEDFFKLAISQNPNVKLYIELKGSDLNLAKEVVKIVDHYNLSQNVVFASFSDIQIKEIFNISEHNNRHFNICYIIQYKTDNQSFIDKEYGSLPDKNYLQKFLGFVPCMLFIDQYIIVNDNKTLKIDQVARLEKLRQDNIKIAVWTVNDENIMKLIYNYVDYIVTDKPQSFSQVEKDLFQL